PPCLLPLTILKVATFWKEEQKYSLTYFPTSGLAKALTRNASALFQVRRGSSKLPETCNTKTSFSCFLAAVAASEGGSTNSMAVSWLLHVPGSFFSPAHPTPAPSSRARPSHVIRRTVCLLPGWDLKNVFGVLIHNTRRGGRLKVCSPVDVTNCCIVFTF